MVKKEYQKAIVTFIDILGFSNMVRSEECHSIYKKIALLNTFNNRKQLEEGGCKECYEGRNKPSSFSFSDSIVRVRPIYEDHENDVLNVYLGDELADEIWDMGYMQIELLKYNILLRGGISIGDIYFNNDKSVIYGDALIDAYKLESNVAKYPRIILDIKNICEEFGKVERFSLSSSNEYVIRTIKKLTRKAEGGIRYIDYLGICESDNNNGQEGFIEYLSCAHKKLIENTLKGSGNEEYRRKYIFLKQYHNSIVERYFESDSDKFGFTKDKLLIK